jgi:hypothetical protein
MRNHVIAIVLAAAGSASAQPLEAPGAEQPPPGSTHATFVSTTEMPWDVTLDRQPVCTTPCSLWVVPMQYVALRSREWRPVRLDVGYLQGGDVTFAAEPLRRGKWAGGIVGVTFASMALVTGITLTSVGCATHDSTMCTGGIITGAAGGLGLYASILLMKSALPKVRLGAARPYANGQVAGLAGSF